MDALWFKAGMHTLMAPRITAAASNGEVTPSVSAAQAKNSPWGFTFRQPLRSLWPGGKTRQEPTIAVHDDVLVEEKDDVLESKQEVRNRNWVFKILHVRSLWKEEKKHGDLVEELGVRLEKDGKDCGGETDGCYICDDDDDEKIELNKETFSKLLRKVPLSEARQYAQMSYLGSLAYSISQIKPGHLLRHHGLRLVTSSLAKKAHASKIEQERLYAEEPQLAAEAHDSKCYETENAEGRKAKANEKRINPSTAYQIAASAASYLHSHTRSIFRFKCSKSDSGEEVDVASLMATTDSVTAVVAAKEEVKQAVADDLNSNKSSLCEWFVCDDERCNTRFFAIQGSESMASWKANLLFEPIQFEGLDVLVHRGIYEAAKGIYERMLPEIHDHLESYGDCAKFRFTGHSLGGSLSLLVNLMLLIRQEAPRASLLPVITFGSPSIMCGGDRLLRQLGLPRDHIKSITMHRDIVPRAFSCNYPSHVAEFLKAVNGSFRNLPCLNNHGEKNLYAPMGDLLILQPDDDFSPNHELLPSGTGLYVLTCREGDVDEAEKQIRAAQTIFLNSPHPLEILSDRAAYGSNGAIQRDHDMNSYYKTVRDVIRVELSRIRKVRRKAWRPVVAPGGIIVSQPGSAVREGHMSFAGVVQTGRESFKRFSRLVASQHMHLLVVVLLPARLLILGTFNLIRFHS